MGSRPHIVIIGGGFAGMAAARALKKADADITLLDRRNHHLFQPLLYQVATAGLSPGEIAEPIRTLLRNQKNTTVRLDEATKIDAPQKTVHLASGQTIPYDYLIVATGVSHNYFGKPEWEDLAPGLKTLEDAVTIRRRFLLSFETAEQEPDAAKRRALLTFVIVGGGPTGVELAGTMAEMAHDSMPGDFRRIQPDEPRVLLLQGGDRILPTYTPDLSEKAAQALRDRKVEVRVNAYVTKIEHELVHVGDEAIPAANVFWAAGVAASPLVRTLGAPCEKSGCVQVTPDLSIPDHPEVFVVGDTVALTDAKQQRVPGVAPAALQMGQYAAKVILAKLHNKPKPEPFAYWDKGSLATIGRGAAVGQAGKIKFSGLLAWLAWLFIHLYFLVGFDNRMIVLIQWFWAYVNYRQGARLITDTYVGRHNPREANL
jgi:NADH dehydrogenase